MSARTALFKNSEIKSSMISGFSNTFSAFGLIMKNKSLIPYFVIPFILNIIILSVIFYFAYTSLLPMAETFLAGNQWYMQIIRFLVSPVLLILLSIFTVFIYSIMGGIITAPFLDLLSSETEKVLGVKNDENFSLKQLISDILRALMNTLRLLILVVFINLVLLLLNLFPGGSFVYAFINFLTALFFYGFQFYDFPLERRRYRFNEKLRITWKFKWSVLGTGFAFFLVSFIPVIGFLGFNLCTVGAAVTFIQDIKDSLA
jgi:CysZ protein